MKILRNVRIEGFIGTLIPITATNANIRAYIER
jgi:hypothetical protein